MSTIVRCAICGGLLSAKAVHARHHMPDGVLRSVHTPCKVERINQERRAELARLDAIETHEPDSCQPAPPTPEQQAMIDAHNAELYIK